MNKTKTNLRFWLIVFFSPIILLVTLAVAAQFGYYLSSDGAAQTRRGWKALEGWQLPQCKQITGVKLMAFVQNGGGEILFADEDKGASLENKNPVCNLKFLNCRVATKRF